MTIESQHREVLECLADRAARGLKTDKPSQCVPPGGKRGAYACMDALAELLAALYVLDLGVIGEGAIRGRFAITAKGYRAIGRAVPSGQTGRSDHGNPRAGAAGD